MSGVEKDMNSTPLRDEVMYGYRHGSGGERRFSNSNSRVVDEDRSGGSMEELKPLKGETIDERPPEHRNSLNNNKVKRNQCKDFDEILEMIGTQGRFQQILLYAVLCPIVTVSPFLVLNTVFMWDIPEHHCHVPGRPAEMSLQEWQNMTLPWELGSDLLEHHSSCLMYSDWRNRSGGNTSCQFGWEYDKTDYESTIPSEFNWVCEEDYRATECFTWGSIGSAIGTVVFGILADKKGRKLAFFLACGTNLLFKTASLFYAHNYTLYRWLQLLGGTAFPAIFSMPALISAEVSGTTYRSWIYAVTWMIWVVGNSVIPFVAMVCRGWFLFGCVAAIPGFLLFMYIPVIHESPRWLITVGEAEQAIQIILRIARTNGKTVNPNEIEQMVHELTAKIKKEQQEQSVGVWTLFSKPRIAKNTVMLIIAWTMNMLLYYGATLNSTKMPGNKFLNYFYLGIIELPGGYVAGWLVDRSGRRWTQAAFFLMCTLSCLISALFATNKDAEYMVILGALGIKFGVTITSLVVYLQGTELFPTQLRSTGSGLASTVASTIGIFGPYIVYTGTVNLAYPFAILCFCSFLGLLSSACLPETFRQHLPETIEDANKFGKGHKFWSYLPKDLQHPEKSGKEEENKLGS